MLSESDLSQFTGTENYHRNFTGLIYTDGINYVADYAGAYWLIDAVGSHQPALKRNQSLQEFQLWTLTVNADKSAVLECREDSGMSPAVTQKIPYTDFPLSKFEFYVEGGEMGLVMLLKSEH